MKILETKTRFLKRYIHFVNADLSMVKLKSTLTYPFIALALIFLVTCAAESDKASESAEQACVKDDRVLRIGFYSDFKPVSYLDPVKDRDPNYGGCHSYNGYEADLLKALQEIDGAGLSFSCYPISSPFGGIWLKAAQNEYDIVGGGITIREDRTIYDGEPAIVFTSGHISFFQTLLVRSEDKDVLDSYDRLTSSHRVGVVAKTTGEERLLQLTGIINESGILVSGTRIVIEMDGKKVEITADGTNDYINAAGESETLEHRKSFKHILPAQATMPQVVYYNQEADLLNALKNEEIDAVARGYAGNSDASVESGGAFVVTARDPDLSKVERGGFALAVEDADLVSCINQKINMLTDNGKIDLEDWNEDNLVFMNRARNSE